MDRRDELTWAALELSRAGELKVEAGDLEKSLRKDLGVAQDWPIFIPATTYIKDGKVITVHLLEGYAFVATGLAETLYFKLENRGYVNSVMSQAGGGGIRALSVISNSNIEEMRLKLRDLVSEDIEIGSRVKVTEGIYRALDGYVLGVEEDQVFLKIELRSLNVITRIPRIFLDIME